MRSALGIVLAWSMTLSQFLAMLLCLIFMSDSFLNVYYRPTLGKVALICTVAVSAIILGWGAYQTVRQRTVTIPTVVTSAYSGVLLWYVWVIVLPGFHG